MLVFPVLPVGHTLFCCSSHLHTSKAVMIAWKAIMQTRGLFNVKDDGFINILVSCIHTVICLFCLGHAANQAWTFAMLDVALHVSKMQRTHCYKTSMFNIRMSTAIFLSNRHLERKLCNAQSCSWQRYWPMIETPHPKKSAPVQLFDLKSKMLWCIKWVLSPIITSHCALNSQHGKNTEEKKIQHTWFEAHVEIHCSFTDHWK